MGDFRWGRGEGVGMCRMGEPGRRGGVKDVMLDVGDAGVFWVTSPGVGALGVDLDRTRDRSD